LESLNNQFNDSSQTCAKLETLVNDIHTIVDDRSRSQVMLESVRATLKKESRGRCPICGGVLKV
jgi:hypothetical protein